MQGVITRLAGISLIALGVACWPDNVPNRALHGMLTYNTLAMFYLAGRGLRREWTGVLLWPAIVVHAGIAAGLAVAWFRRGRIRSR